MKTLNKKFANVLKVATFSALALTTIEASAAVQFRVGFDADAGHYAVYMTPDSTPSPDMLLSAQITVVAPNTDGQQLDVNNIQSTIDGVTWASHSRVDGPIENPNADYISLGYFFNGTNPPQFNWVAGEEKKILSFDSESGCVAGVKLIDGQDPFNQLPNSAGTNPGNDFMNVGWLMSNAYVGNYGGTVSCGETPSNCEPTAMDQYYLNKIATLENLKADADPARQTRINILIDNLKSKLSCDV